MWGKKITKSYNVAMSNSSWQILVISASDCLKSGFILSKLIQCCSNFGFISFGLKECNNSILAFLPKNAKNMLQLIEKYDISNISGSNCWYYKFCIKK